ncbi:MAG: hypothetical protein OXM02_12815 [Bacteroidota bacterium]|nr:hypothetical protein [Bacteroidota bacterium]MDE2957828.1 hypothetical protein [Bacteroidota bacterium]
MFLNKSFSEFLQKSVNLNPSRLDRIKSAHRSVRASLEQDDWIREHAGRTLLQGSYALNTAIKSPHADKPYDVDVVLGMELMDQQGLLPHGAVVLLKVKGALEAVSMYSGKTRMLNRCIRVAYSSDGLDFHLDVLPAHLKNGDWKPLQIPQDWRESNPKGYIEWFRMTNSDHGGFLPKVARLLKFWRDLHRLEHPNSMVLTTLAGLHLPHDARSVDEALALTMAGISAWAGQQPNHGIPRVLNPSLKSENLARNWPPHSIGSFRERIGRASSAAEAALKSRGEEETIKLWNGPNLFDGRFPTTIRGIGKRQQEIAKRFAVGGITVGLDGIIGGSGISTPNNEGFYGE